MASVSKSFQERALFTRSQLRAELTTLMAGCAAEELMLGEPSSGAEDDLIRATELAQIIVGRYGMSERLGRVHLVRTESGEFLGGPSTPSELTAGPVLMDLHQEVRRLMDESEAAALDLLQRHRSVLLALSDRLEEQETLEGAELETMLEPVRPEMNLVTASVEPVTANGGHPHSWPKEG